MDDIFEDLHEENNATYSNYNGYEDYFDCYNDDLDPDQQSEEFWNQF